MRSSGPILIVSAALAVLFLVLYMLSGNQWGTPGPGPVKGASGADHPEHTIQEVLSGDFKRTPKKNPVRGDGKLRCAIQNGDGVPAAGATVEVTPLVTGANILEPRPEYREFWEATAGADGTVTFRALSAGSFLVIATQGDAHALGKVVVPATTAFGELSLILSPTLPLKGSVKDANGTGIEGAVIAPIHAPNWAGDAGAYRAVPVESDASGNFTHPLVPPGDWQLLVSAKGYAPQLLRAPEGAEVSVTLDRGATYHGRVLLSGEDRPLSNVKVIMQALDSPGETYSARTNGQGIFSFELLRPASYRLVLESGSHVGEQTIQIATSQRAAETGALPESRNMRVDPLTGTAVATPASVAQGPEEEALAPDVPVFTAVQAGSIRGRVMAGPAQTGVGGVVVGAYQNGMAAPAQSATSDQAGYYHLKPLPAGEYTLVAQRAGGRVFSVLSEPVVTVLSGQQATGPDFSEESTVALNGRVLDSEGAPVAEANVYLEIAGAASYPQAVGADMEGRFKIGGLSPSDQIKLHAGKMGAKSPLFGPVTIGAEGLREILLRIAP